MNLPLRLSDKAVEVDHDGMVLELPLVGPLLGPGFATLLTLVAVPLSLLAVALPAAALFEDQRWWLVNEVLLVERWLCFGPVVAFGSWWPWSWLLHSRRTVRLKLERRRLVLQRRWGKPRIVHARDVRLVRVNSRRLKLVRHDDSEEDIHLPLQNPRLLEDLAQLIVDQAREDGSAEAIPEVLQDLRGRQAPQTIRG